MNPFSQDEIASGPCAERPIVSRRGALGMSAAALAGCVLAADGSTAEVVERVLIVVGPSSHPPGTHEVAAGGRLLTHCVENAGLAPVLRAELIERWPTDASALSGVVSVVFIGDLFPPEVMPDRDRIMAELTTLMKAGGGIVCIHYATGLGAKQVPPDGDHPLLKWLGGYFATRCPHHQSVARIFPEARIEPGTAKHPVLRGWRPFTVHDEPYINNYFGPAGPADNVTALATSLLPPEAPQRETVAWAVTRPDGGRGVGVVMPHFYRNWRNDDLRTLILNSIFWTARREIPDDGVRVTLPDLVTFKPAAVEPPAKAK